MAQHSAARARRPVILALAALLVAGAALAPVPALGAPSSSLTRYPYLTDLVGGSVTVNWATTRTAKTASVTIGKVGTVPACASRTVAATRTSITVKSVSQYQWRATVPGLERDATYCYRVYLGTSPRTDLLGSDPSPTFRGELPERPAEPFSFAVFGDWGQANSGSANPNQEALLARLAKSDARFAVGTGDIANPSGSQSNYGDLYQTGSSVSGVFGPKFWAGPGKSLPYFPAVGNHNPNSTFLVNWPQPKAVATSNGRYQLDTYCCVNGTQSKDYASAWYAFDAGGARFYVLQTAWSASNLGEGTQYKNDYDTHWTPTSPEYKWLEADLAAHASTPLKFAFFHYPLYSDQSSQTSNAFLQGAGSLEGLLSRNGVDIAFNGHAHMYQRNLKPHAGGLVSYVSGGGGRRWRRSAAPAAARPTPTGSAGRARPAPAPPAGPHRRRPGPTRCTTSCWSRWTGPGSRSPRPTPPATPSTSPPTSSPPMAPAPRPHRAASPPPPSAPARSTCPGSPAPTTSA